MPQSSQGRLLPISKLHEAKKRKTEDYTGLGQLEPAGIPPITVAQKGPMRPSAVKRDWPPKTAYLQSSYASSASASATAAMTSTVRPVIDTEPTVRLATTNLAASKHTPHVDGVKFTNEKILFAESSTSVVASSAKTPANKAKQQHHKAADTPQGMEGDDISLPEIPTDSEDDDMDSSAGSSAAGKKFSAPKWAESPELRQALFAQQTMDPEEVFGPMAPLRMEEIFKNRRGKMRPRTSSANWAGQDRLTAEEIQADAEARKRMVEHGGWTYGNI